MAEVVPDIFCVFHSQVGQSVQDKLIIWLDHELSLEQGPDESPAFAICLDFVQGDFWVEPHICWSSDGQCKVMECDLIRPTIGWHHFVNQLDKFSSCDGVLVLLSPKLRDLGLLHLEDNASVGALNCLCLSNRHIVDLRVVDGSNSWVLLLLVMWVRHFRNVWVCVRLVCTQVSVQQRKHPVLKNSILERTNLL